MTVYPFCHMSREEFLAEFDELHLLGAQIAEEDPERAIRQLEDLFIHAYMLGRKHTCDELDEADWAYFEDLMQDREHAEALMNTIYRRIEDKDFADRLREHMANDTPGLISTLIETEFHRDYCAGGESLAEDYRDKSGLEPMKRWATVGDDRVRDTHFYLHGRVVRLGEDFYTYDGDHAPYPGRFMDAANNVNCRCWITYTLG